MVFRRFCLEFILCSHIAIDSSHYMSIISASFVKSLKGKQPIVSTIIVMVVLSQHRICLYLIHLSR